MDFRKLTDDLNIISALGDNPNADNALTPSGLKAKFDEAALKIKHYLNEVLIPDLYTAVESEEFRGQPGLSPTVEAERFQDSTGSGVKLVITTPAPPDSGLLDSIISIPLYDGENGVTPKISNVDIEVLEYGADASAEITGPTNNLNLLLKIPRGEPGRTGDTPFIRTSGIVHTDGRHGTQFAIYASQSAVNPSQTVTVYDGKDGEKGDPGKSPTVTVTKKRLSDGRMEATIAVINADGSSQSATVTDGKDGAPGAPGEPGYTPQKGIDYWTPEDKQEIVDDVLAELPETGGGGSGGSNDWALVNTVTVEGDTTGQVVINTDAEGNKYEFREIVVFANGTISKNIYFDTTGDNGSRPFQSQKDAYMPLVIYANEMFILMGEGNNGGSGMVSSKYNAENKKISYVRLSTKWWDSQYFTSGTTITLYGRK